MKLYSTIMCLTFLCLTVYSREEVYLWPIQGQKAGEGIMYKPQDMISEEYNFSDLFITAKEGSLVIAPSDATITVWYYQFQTSLYSNLTFTHKEGTDENIRETIASEHWKEKKERIDPKNINIYVGLKTDSGLFYYLGIKPLKKIKTGYTIKRGEIIGSIDYCYHAISEPCLQVSRLKNGIAADPMTPFGIKSSFIPYKKPDPLTKYPPEELKEAFTILKESLEEGHPGLYDYVSKDSLDKKFNEINNLIKTPLSSGEFYELIYPLIASIKDSHTMLVNKNEEETQATSQPSVCFGWLNDSLVVIRSTTKYKEYIGKRIVEINGINANFLLNKIEKTNYIDQEGYIESQKDFKLLTVFWIYYFNHHPLKDEDIYTLTFSDGTKKSFPYRNTKGCIMYVPDWSKYMRMPNFNFQTKKLNEKTALLDLNTFSLNEMEKDDIADFIKEIRDSSFHNLIIDVRNNMGGNSSDFVYELIAQKPYKTFLWTMVNQNDTYKFFKYSTNYPEGERNIFMDYKAIEGKPGYYLEEQEHYPNDSIHFDGNIYVITNERSYSDATRFAALVHKYCRGLIVGRETGSTYYQMNAVKNVDVRLANTGLYLRMPLVKCVFDSVGNSNIPWGRGVLPDYPVNFTLEEFTCKNDTTLNYTLALIDKFGEKSNVADLDRLQKSKNALNLDTSIQKNRCLMFILIGFTVLCLVVGIIWFVVKTS